MQVTKGDQNGYLVPGGIAVPPCPRIYKYGGLAFQVGGWVTGWQPIIVKMLTIRKPKLWTQNSQTEWSQPRQWKRINERIAWAMNELMKQMDKYKVNICALHKIRWSGKGTVIKNYMILYSGHKSNRHQFGTGFYISRHIIDY